MHRVSPVILERMTTLIILELAELIRSINGVKRGGNMELGGIRAINS